MRIDWKTLAMALGLAVALATAASAERRWIVVGFLDAIDEGAQTLVIDDKTVRVVRTTTMKDTAGGSASWDDLVDYEGDYVSVLVSAGSPHPIAETVVLGEEEADADIE